MSFLDENFWVAISFIIFLYFAYKPVKKAIIQALDERVLAIRTELSKSENLKKEAEQLLKKVSSDVAKLGKIKEELLERSSSNNKNMLKKKKEEFEILLARKEAEVFDSIDKQKLLALNQVKEELMKLVVKISSNYLQDNNESVLDREILDRFTKSS